MTHRIYTVPVASVYPHYIAKVERKGGNPKDVDRIICWLTGYDQAGLESELNEGSDFETFFAQASNMNPDRKQITGVICGVRVEEIEEPLMQEIRYMDKLVDELVKGKSVERILRES